MADPTRRILDTLRDGPTDVGELVAQLDISQPLASKHLAVLRNGARPCSTSRA
jgi:DNA-binding transcriptional ArsR family regulator